MGETLLGKPYGLTHEDTIKAHHLFTATAKKTPYQLDLEIMDRKPDIIPKVGDKVKIKSREWYEKWKDSEWDVRVLYSFIEAMAKHCGRVLTVKEVSFGSRDWRFRLEEDEKEMNWSLEMFEEVYPQESSKEEKCAKSLYSSSNSASALEKQLTPSSAIPALNSVQGIGIATDWSKLISDTANRITLPQQSLFCNTGFYYQSILKDEEPELQTIKKHRFIKLEKL